MKKYKTLATVKVIPWNSSIQCVCDYIHMVWLHRKSAIEGTVWPIIIFDKLQIAFW